MTLSEHASAGGDHAATRSQGGSYRPLVVLAAACLAGIGADRWLAPHWLARGESPSLLATWWSAGAAALTLRAALRRPERAGLLVLVAAAAAGGLAHHFHWHYFADDDLARFATRQGTPVAVRSRVVEGAVILPEQPTDPLRPVARGPITQVVVAHEAVRDGRHWRSAGGTSRLWIEGQRRDLVPGDRVELVGHLRLVAAADNPGQADRQREQRARRRFSDLFCSSPDDVVRIAAAPLSAALVFHHLRCACADRLEQTLGPAAAPLGQAVVLGLRNNLEPHAVDAFVRTGSIHVLVISGLHVSMVAAMVWGGGTALGLRRRRRLELTAVTTLLFTGLAGATPSVLRAATVTLAMLASLAAGRRTSRLNALAAAALLVLACNPAEAFRSGTQLSFLSVAVLLALSVWLRRRRAPDDPLDALLADAASWPQKTWRRLQASWTEATLAAVAVSAVTFPLVQHHFLLAAPVGILLAPFILPLVAVGLATGLGLLTLGWLLPPATPPLALACRTALEWTGRLVDVGEQIPGATHYGPGPPVWWLLVFYAGLAAAGWRLSRGPGRRQLMLAGLVVWSAAGLATLPGPDRERTAARCTFLSLGHGGCTFCEFPDGSNLMYDAGSLGSPDFAARTVAQFLAARGVRRIDRLIISHADLDHFNAVPGILACFPVGTIYVPPHMTDPARQQADEPGLPYLLAEIRRRAVPLENLAAGADVELAGGQGRLRVLHPPPGPTEGSDNAASLVTAVEFAGRRLLLTGDLQSPGLETVTRQPAWDCDVLLAPHHGSAHSDPPGFAAWSTPEWVVISGGGRASTLSTVAAYQACGACVLETAEQGAVELLLDPKGVRAATYRQGAFDPRPRPAAASRPSGPAKSTFGTAGLENGSP